MGYQVNNRTSKQKRGTWIAIAIMVLVVSILMYYAKQGDFINRIRYVAPLWAGIAIGLGAEYGIKKFRTSSPNTARAIAFIAVLLGWFVATILLMLGPKVITPLLKGLYLSPK